jgi:hypothetical protein
MPIAASGVLRASKIRNELGLTGQQSFNTLQNLAFSTPLRTLTKVSKFYNYDNNFKLTTTSPTTVISQIIYNTTGYIYIFRATTQYNTSSAIFTEFSVTINNKKVEVLLVAGGGGGGAGAGAGGGAGGLVYVPIAANLTLNGTYKIRVGSGGIGMQSTTNETQLNGTDSTILDINDNVILKAIGGAMGYGYHCITTARLGGNAAGGNWNIADYSKYETPQLSIQKTGTTGLSSTYGYCNNAGNSILSSGSGGGSGAGGNGGNANSTVGGNGGAAFACPITGTTTYYAAGGGGQTFSDYSYRPTPTGGYGGVVMLGGNGSHNAVGSRLGGNAVNDTGSGGGGGAGDKGGNGSAGICIIRIPVTIPTIVANSISGNFINITNTLKYYYIFTSTTGTNTITFTETRVCEVLIIGGGGGGAGGFAGSGGAGGGVNYRSSYTFNAGTYTIIVGSGGNGGIGYNQGNWATPGAGGNPSIIKLNNVDLLVANGGGGSATTYRYIYGFQPAAGGSTSVDINGVVTIYYGGGGWASGGQFISGGGAGAGQNGTTGSPSSYGNGGNGYLSDITGTAIYFAGGGAGAPTTSMLPADGGSNGLGQNNYGGGGRGYSRDNTRGQDGYSGCVIIAFDL